MATLTIKIIIFLPCKYQINLLLISIASHFKSFLFQKACPTATPVSSRQLDDVTRRGKSHSHVERLHDNVEICIVFCVWHRLLCMYVLATFLHLFSNTVNSNLSLTSQMFLTRWKILKLEFFFFYSNLPLTSQIFSDTVKNPEVRISLFLFEPPLNITNFSDTVKNPEARISLFLLEPFLNFTNLSDTVKNPEARICVFHFFFRTHCMFLP